jgi:K+/H+ antiporter YhaU regulatory subunit KhtT
MSDVEVGATRLPGVGWRYDIPLARDTRLFVVVEDGGRRHLVLSREGSDEPWLSVPLQEQQAFAVAALLTGTRLTMVEREVMSTHEPHGETAETLIESVTLHDHSRMVGVPISVLSQQLRPHAEILGVVSDATPQILEDDPERPLQAGDHVVVAARHAHRAAVLAALEG